MLDTLLPFFNGSQTPKNLSVRFQAFVRSVFQTIEGDTDHMSQNTTRRDGNERSTTDERTNGQDTGERTDTRRRHHHPANTTEKRRCADCHRDLVLSLFPSGSDVCRDCTEDERR
jgi:hypothetical protein